jgi:hypothetical protein
MAAQLDQNSMVRIAEDFRVGPDQEVPLNFLETLGSYSEIIRSRTADMMTKQYSHIPPVVEAVLSQSAICSNQDVADMLADSLLAFMCCSDDKPGVWASNQVLLRTRQTTTEPVSFFECSKADCLDAIYAFPSEYVSQLSDQQLSSIALMCPPGMMNLVIEELLRRKLPFAPALYEAVVLETASPHLVVHAFRRFFDVPTFESACTFVEVFKQRPQLHIVCANEAVTAKRRTALAILGRAIQKAFPLKFTFDLFFHPAIAPVVREVERTRGKVKSGDIAGLRTAAAAIPYSFFQFMPPLLFEFPELLEALLAMPAYRELLSYFIGTRV